jgi:ATP-dependent RNA helicase SUPV3L1/SUV3
MEVFYTFRWAPKPRQNRRPQGEGQGRRGGPRRDNAPDAPREPRADRPERAERQDRPEGGRPNRERREDRGHGEGGKPRGKDGFKKGGKPQHNKPATFSSRPEKKADPDSPFAILAALKDKK